MQGFIAAGRTSVRLSLLVLHFVYAFGLVIACRTRHGRNWYDSVAGRWIIRNWMGGVCRILAIRINVNGVPDKSAATLFVANHVSWLDIVALGSVLETKFLSKATVRHWPVIGWLAMASGTLFISRNRNFVINRAISQIRTELDKQNSVLLFPEGTTGEGRQVGRFHTGLFKAVSGVDHSVQAIALRYQRAGKLDTGAAYIGNDNFVGHLIRIAGRRETRLTLQFTPVFQTLELSRHEIAESARTVIVNLLREGRESGPEQLCEENEVDLQQAKLMDKLLQDIDHRVDGLS